MTLSAIGDFQFLSQMYNYKGHRIACSIKVLPTPAPVTNFELETRNDYHWMTAVRWAHIESAIYRLFDKLPNWQNAKKLREELLVDHIIVRVQATEKPYPVPTSLLAGAKLAPEDLSLDIQLQYKTVKNTSILGMHATKRQPEAKDIVKSSSSSSSRSSTRNPRAGAGSGGRPKSGIQEKLTKSKPKHIDSDDQDDIQDENCLTNASSSRLGKRRSLSASGGKSTASSSESKVARRSKEEPSAVKNLKGKPTTSSPGKAVKEKSLTPKPAEPPMGELMDGARLDALKRLDSMLDIPKPPEVPILLLENMTEADVLATFEGYKTDFDKLFNERKDQSHTYSYMNVSHMDVMDIFNADIRKKMMKKLADSYSTRTPHTSMVINGLLPLWIILLFMDKYKLSHGDAVRQIKDQLKWSSYLKAVNNEPLSSDLDD